MRGLYLTSVWLHVLAAMTWIGGMVVFVAAVMPWFRRRPEAEKAAFLDWFGQRFRVISWTSFAVLTITGVFNLWVRGVRLGDFFRPDWHGTSFGQMVMVKLTLVAAALALTILHERKPDSTWARWMGRALLLVGVGIVAAAVMLVRAI